MCTLGGITMFSAEDICKAFHVTKITAYKILALPQANAVKIGRKILITEQNLSNILSKKIAI